MTDLTLFNPNTKHQGGVWFDFSLKTFQGGNVFSIPKISEDYWLRQL